MVCIHAIYRECPGESIVYVFGDGSIYRYPAGLVDAVAVRGGAVHGRVFNLPAVRRRPRPPWSSYERLEAVPSGALLLYEEPPYDPSGPVPDCGIDPATQPVLIQMDATSFGYWSSICGLVSDVWIRSGPVQTAWMYVALFPAENSTLSAGILPPVGTLSCGGTALALFDKDDQFTTPLGSYTLSLDIAWGGPGTMSFSAVP